MSQSERLQRFQAELRAHGLAGALLGHPASVRYLTGYTPPIETGPSPFWGGPALAVIGQEGPAVLVVAEGEEVAAPPGLVEVLTYPGYTAEGPLMPEVGYRAAVRRALDHLGRRGPLGVERATLPLLVAEVVRDQAPGVEFREIGDALARQRAVKSPDEVACLRAAVRLCDIGQQAVKELARPALAEIALFNAVRERMETAAGRRLPLLADLLSGPRTRAIGGPPTSRLLQPGDLVLVDLAPCLNGYWGDSCNTVVLGDPPSSLRRLFQVVQEALAAGTDAIRPGVAAEVVDAVMRERLRSAGYTCPHHTGHGLGVTYHEEPRLVPGNPQPLAAGMVIALEPGVYTPEGWGVRLEHVVLVTGDGAEVLSGFRHTL